MTKPSQFIYTTDYSSIWSDTPHTIAVTIPGSINIPNLSSVNYFTDLAVPSGAHLLWSKLTSSLSPTVVNVNRSLYRSYNAGGGRFVSLQTYVYKPSPSVIRVLTVVSNNNPLSPGALTTSATPETITAIVRLMSVPQ